MKSLILVLPLLFTNLAKADSICAYSLPNSDDQIPFETVVQDKLDPDQESEVLERLQVEDYSIELSRGVGINELVIKQGDKDIFYSAFDNDKLLNVNQMFAAGSINCSIPGLGVDQGDEEEAAE